MKKINLWLILLLSVVTLGIYTFVWLARRRNEMVAKYGRQIPHWLWLILPFAAFLGLLGLVMFVGPAFGWDEETTVVTTVVTMLVSAGVLLAIHIWWIWRFAKAAAYVTNGKMPAGWTLALYFLVGEPTALFLQYYFNRAESPKELGHKPAQKPSRKLMLLATLTIAVSLVLAAILLVTADYSEFEKADREARTLEEKANRLTNEYNDCTRELDEDFPEVTVDNEKQYDLRYAACDSILIEQHNAADEYNRLISE